MLAVFEQVYGAFEDFHAYFAPLFGRREARDHSRHYLQALLVQYAEKDSARVMQAESPWDDDTVIGSRVPWDPGLVRRRCGSGRQRLPQAGQEVRGSSVFGQGGQLPGRNVASARWAGPWWTMYLPESWTSDKDRCEAAGVPEERQGYRSPLEMLGRVLERGHLRAGWVAGDEAFGMSPLPGGTSGSGDVVRAGRSRRHHRLALGAGLDQCGLSGVRASQKAQAGGRIQRRTIEQRSEELPGDAWREITVAEGSQGPRSYMFSAQRVRVTRRRKPGEMVWAVYRRNLDGSEPRYYLSNAPEDTPLETLAYVGGSRWRIETEFETEKSDVGLDEYETRTWAGWHHHVALCLLGGAFLLSLQQAWGEKDAPDHEAAGLPGGAGIAAQGTVRAG